VIHADLIAVAEHLAAGVFEEDELEALADSLYGWYLNVSPLPEPSGPLLPYELDLPAVLRVAHVNSTSFEGGWRAETVSTWGRAVAHKGEISRVLDRCEYTVPARRGLRAQPNDALVVSHCWDWIDEETGFWHLRKGAWPPPGADRLVRTYWNCVPAETPSVLKELTSVLGAARDLSYVVKTPSQAAHNGRSDALVLYLGPSGFATVEGDLRSLASFLSRSLRPRTPRMALAISPCVAVAEGSLEGASFGQSRCRIIAGAFVAAEAEERRSEARLTELITAAFVTAGLDPRRPDLEPGSRRA